MIYKHSISFSQITLLAVFAGVITPVSAQIFSDDFDDGNAMSRFSLPFFSLEQAPPDGFVDYAIDYGAFGIAPAPKSNGTTLGIGFNINPTDDGAIDEGEGIGVSPIIASLPTAYTVSFNAFAYYQSGGGASEHIMVGVNADSTAAPYTFSPSGAGQFYSIPHDSGLANPGFIDDYYRIADGVQTELYDGDDEDADAAPDASTIGVFPAGTDPVFDDPGFAGNQWMEVTLTVDTNILTLYINGYVIDSFDNSGGTTSGNIVIGGADIFNSANATNYIIFDNLLVVDGVVPPPPPLMDSADFDGDGDVDGRDFVIWQRGYGIVDGTALPMDGDANGDQNVDEADLAVWQLQYGIDDSPLVSLGTVPEPSTLLLGMLTCLAALRCRR